MCDTLYNFFYIFFDFFVKKIFFEKYFWSKKISKFFSKFSKIFQIFHQFIYFSWNPKTFDQKYTGKNDEKNKFHKENH